METNNMHDTSIPNGYYCQWCGTNIDNVSQITYFNGNLPICDLCFEKMEMEILHYIMRLGGTIEKFEGEIK